MFGDLLGNMEERQAEMKKKLATIIVEASSGDGVVKVSASAARQLTNIQFDPEFLKTADQEEIEDLILVAVNEVMELAAAKEAEEAQNMLKDMLPPGLGDMGGMFS
ncbi:MAG: YbaB/EbfC family nucleoid-associated protein [Saprospiraceae bacterium]|nr:YbaB/EbfC family nucleoid-associated protein [Saprospiraceae bacterium]